MIAVDAARCRGRYVLCLMLGIHSSVWTWPIYIHLSPKAANNSLETLSGVAASSGLIDTISHPMGLPHGDASPDFPIWVIMGGTPQQPPVQFHDAGPLPGTLFCRCGPSLLKRNYCRLFIVGAVEKNIQDCGGSLRSLEEDDLDISSERGIKAEPGIFRPSRIGSPIARAKCLLIQAAKPSSN